PVVSQANQGKELANVVKRDPVGRTGGHAGGRSVRHGHRSHAHRGGSERGPLAGHSFRHRDTPRGGGAGRVSRAAEGTLRTHRTSQLLHGRRCFFGSSCRPGRLLAGKQGPRVADPGGRVGITGWVRALRGGYPAGGSVAALVRRGDHRRLARIDTPGGVRELALRPRLAGSGLHALVAKKLIRRATLACKLSFRGPGGTSVPSTRDPSISDSPARGCAASLRVPSLDR